MVRAPLAGPSRTASSAAGSVARDILKKREKPYKTETSKVLAKKRKLNINTSYKHAPNGYSFLPVGTPDLADLCKKLSKERDLPVSVVNTKPTNRMATDPSKLSHHVHRIGYHFQSEVLEQAVQELNYTLLNGQFIKEEDLAKKYQEGLTAKILAKHGVKMNSAGNQESHAQVRAAIKELFPKIPTDDLEGIVKHAWEEGTGRVGSAQALDLPRRVQLAVIARIRHKYTDYDQLLRAFEWKEARRLTEPVSLQKLIEWRGEQDTEEDDQLEEMVRETIVIDDDDDDDATLANGSEADDEDSTVEQGDNSDASIEVINHLADDTDIGGESTYEGPRYPRRAQQAPRRSQRLQKQNVVARQKLAAAYQARRAHVAGGQPNPNIETVILPPGANTGAFQIDGVTYEMIPPTHGSSAPPQHTTPQQGLRAPQYAPQSSPNDGVTYDPRMRHPLPVQDRPVPSIERGNGFRVQSQGNGQPHGLVRSRPITPDQEYSSKRRRVDQSSQYGPPSNVRNAALAGGIVDLTTPEQPRRMSVSMYNGEVVDLMTPEPPHQPYQPSPLRAVARPGPYGDARFKQQPHRDQYHSAYASRQPSPMRISPARQTHGGEPNDLAYDPRQPMLQLPQQVDRMSIRPEQHQQSPYNTMPGAWPTFPAPAPPQAQQYYEVPQQYPGYQQYAPQPTFVFPSAPPPRVVYEQQQPSRPTPQPIHGAPAPVQVVPRYAAHQGYGRPPTVPPPQPPTDGAPAPVQVVPRHAPYSGYG